MWLLPEALLILDMPNGRFVMANAAAERLLGYSQQELAQLSPADLLSTAEGGRLKLAYEQMVVGTASRREWIARPKTGPAMPVGVTSVPVTIDGRTHVLILAHDRSAEDPATQQRLLLALAGERLALSLEYDETLHAIVQLVVPRLADACWMETLDPNSEQQQRVYGTAADAPGADVAVTMLPPAHATPAADRTASAATAEALFRRRLPPEAFERLPLVAHGRDLGTLTMRRNPPRQWTPEARSVATALARRAAQAIDSALLWRTAQRELARRAAILRITRVLAESDPGSDRMMEVLLHEALAMVGGDVGGIALWDAPSSTLIQVFSNSGRSNGLPVSLDNSLSGQAALARQPVISNDYQHDFGRGTPAGRYGARVGIAAPLLHEGRLIGVLSVGSRSADVRFGADEVEAVELLAGIAASMLGTLERSQLQAVTLAARELAHRLNNDLALAVGVFDLLRDEPSLSADMRAMVLEAADGLERVGDQLTQLQRLTRFQTRETPVGPALDLDRSTRPNPDPAAPDQG